MLEVDFNGPRPEFDFTVFLFLFAWDVDGFR